jgi:threonine dehydrogenase-like Zn-dependent dehydrogenase
MASFNVTNAADQIFSALVQQSRTAFLGVVQDLDQHVIPTMASIARSLAVIGGRLADGTYTPEIADVEVAGQIDAAAAVIVRFANRILREIQDIINAVIDAVKQVINTAVRTTLIL